MGGIPIEALATLKKCTETRNEPRHGDFIILALAYEGRGAGETVRYLRPTLFRRMRPKCLKEED